MTQLIKYEAACRAIAECKAIDEVKGLADKAAAMQAYGRMAKDRTLEVDAAEIRIRAERRLGEMLAAQKADGGLASGARLAGSKPGANDGSSAVVANDRRPDAPKLADAGISKDLSSRAQKLAAVPEAEFEAELAAKREKDRQEGTRVSARLEQAGERELKKKAAAAPDPLPEPDTSDELAEARDAIDALATELQETKDRLAVEQMDASEEGKTEAAALIAELRHENLTLTRELDATRSQMNQYMTQCVEMRKQIDSLNRKLKKSAQVA